MVKLIDYKEDALWHKSDGRTVPVAYMVLELVQGGIKGQYSGLINQYGPTDYPTNYGGKYWDIGFGMSAMVPSGDFAGNRVSVEWLQPLQDNVNGYQLERVGTLAASWGFSF